MEHIASLSFGADSMATVILAHIHGEPLDAALYCEVMFDKTISGEVPEHRDFIYNTAIPALEQWGTKTIVLRSESTMKEVFYTRRTEKSRYCGKYIGFPMVGRCEVQKRLKLRPIHAFLKDHPDAVQYVGIATDEKKRLRSLDGKRKVSLLAKYGLTQDDARELCSEYGLLSPIYSFAKRGGCWFCPNAHDCELRHLRTYHPELWNELLRMSKEPDLVRPGAFRVEESLEEIEDRFYWEEQQMNIFDFLGPPEGGTN